MDTDVNRAAGGSLLDFFRTITVIERRTFFACSAGWALDGMDAVMYSLVLGTIMVLWKVHAGPAGLAISVSLVSAAAGGWIAGFASDHLGRVKVLQLSVLWFSATQNFEQLLIVRTLIGFGYGAEWVAGAILMGEVVRPEYRGRAVGSVQASYSIGWGMALILQAVLFKILPPQEAWRWMFGIGALPALIAIYLRRNLQEPVIADRVRFARATKPTPSIWEIFSPPILKTTLLSLLLVTGAQGGLVVIATWLPRYLTLDRHLSVVNSTGYLASFILGQFAGFLVGAWLSDRIGRRMLFVTFSVCAVIMVVAYTKLPLTSHELWLVGLPLGFFTNGYYSGLGPFLTELYPTRLRGSGQGFCYSVGRGLGSIFPLITGYMSAHLGLGAAIAILSSCAYGIFFVSALALPETRGRDLNLEIVK
jgi:MFS family permease